MIFLSLVLFKACGSVAHSATAGLWGHSSVCRSAVHSGKTENGYPGSAFTRPWPNSVELIIAQVEHITSSLENMDLFLHALLGELSTHTHTHAATTVRTKCHTHPNTNIPSFSSLSGSCVSAGWRYNTRFAPLSVFVARILLWYSFSPHQA